MTSADGPGVHDWVVHRPNIVRSVAARVPGIDAEEATSRALEKMVRIVSTGGQIDDPAPYWRRAAVNEAISMTREAGRARPVEDDTLDGLTPPVAGAELDAERQADVSVLRTALSDLAEDDRQILLERHVHRRAVTDIATGLGVRPHAVTMRLRRAEERLAGAFAAAHAQAVNEPECRTTRAAMHDYLKGRLLPRRQERLEIHMDGCTECTRAFIDVREVSWMLRDLGQHFIGGVFVTGSVGGVATGGAAVGGAAVGGAAVVGAGPRAFGKRETSVAAGVVAALVVGGAAAAYLNNQTDPPPQAVVDLSGGGSAAAQPPTQNLPPAFPPADPQPRPATTPKEDAAPAPDPAPAPEQDVSEPAPEPELEPEPEPALEPAGAEPAPAPDERAPADTPAQPAPEEAVDPPAPEPEPAPKPEPEPETQPAPNPPQAEPMSGPPGNPDNGHGMGPTTYSDQGPGNGDGKGQAPDRIDTVGADLGEQLTTLLAVPSVAAAPGIVLLGGTPTQRGLPDAPDSIAT